MRRTHATGVSPEIVEQICKRRGGRLHVYDEIDPTRTALLVVDMQNMFMHPDQPAYCPYGEGIVPNVNRLADAVRRQQASVIWIRMVNTPERRTTWSVYYDFYGPGRRDQNAEATTEGSFGAELWPEMDVRPEDEIVVKSRYSALIPDSSNLHERLVSRDIDTLVITGVATNICCESTARDAHMMNYRTIVVSDGCATRTDALHTASLNTLCLTFADVMTTDEVIGSLELASERLGSAAQ